MFTCVSRPIERYHGNRYNLASTAFASLLRRAATNSSHAKHGTRVSCEIKNRRAPRCVRVPLVLNTFQLVFEVLIHVHGVVVELVVFR